MGMGTRVCHQSQNVKLQLWMSIFICLLMCNIQKSFQKEIFFHGIITKNALENNFF